MTSKSLIEGEIKGRNNWRQWREDGDIVPNRIYVGNLAIDVTETELCEFFMACGEVSHVGIIRASNCGERWRNYGFVSFHHQEVVTSLLESNKQLVLRGRKLLIGQAKQRNQRGPRPGWRTESSLNKEEEGGSIEPCMGLDDKQEVTIEQMTQFPDRSPEMVAQVPDRSPEMVNINVADNQDPPAFCQLACCNPYYQAAVYQGQQQVVTVMSDGSYYYGMPTVLQPQLEPTQYVSPSYQPSEYIPSGGPVYWTPQSGQAMYPVYYNQDMADVYNNNVVYNQQTNNNPTVLGFQDQSVILGDTSGQSQGSVKALPDDSKPIGIVEVEYQVDQTKSANKPVSLYRGQPRQYNCPRTDQRYSYNQQKTGRQGSEWGTNRGRKRGGWKGIVRPREGGDWHPKTIEADTCEIQMQKMGIN